jgi:hypothetical protein
MRRLHTILTVILGLALVVSLVLWRKGQRDVQQELHTLRDANGVLRQTLGDLTVSITQKEQEIDLLRSSCSAAKEPNSFRIPLPRKAEPAKPATGSIGAN